MDLTPKIKQGLMIAAFSLLAVVAVAGWTRTPAAPGLAANSFNAPGTYSNVPPAYGSNVPGYGGQQQQPVAQPVGYGQPGYVPYGQPVGYGPYAQNCGEPLAVQSAAYAPAPAYTYAAPRYRTYSRPRVVRVVESRDRDYVVRRNRRSTGKSVAIVAGSAGAGAAIGALAGGGKGAAIGALTGGVGGFVYDRLTHNR